MLIKLKEAPVKICKAEDVANTFRAILKMESEIDQDKEHLWVMGLSVTNQVKYIELVSLGILTGSLAHPREIFRLAIMKAVECIVLCHNHPSGQILPSKIDDEMTARITKAGNILQVKLIDHIIIGGKMMNMYAYSEKNPSKLL